jgi:hypothetical protein
LVVAWNFYEFTIDIEVAFLNDPPATTVYYEYPVGFPGYDPLRKQWAPGLTNIYGNPDSGRIFWKWLIPRLKEAGLSLIPDYSGIATKVISLRYAICMLITSLLPRKIPRRRPG